MAEAQHYILFTLAGTTYAVRSDEVQQMDMVEKITPVPNAPPAVEGVVFLRGEVIPAVNLRVRFGFPKAPYDLKTRLIVVRVRNRVVGLIVDSARDFVTIPAETVKEPPEGITDLSGPYLKGIAYVGDRLVLIIDSEGVINAGDLAAVREKNVSDKEERDEKRTEE